MQYVETIRLLKSITKFNKRMTLHNSMTYLGFNVLADKVVTESLNYTDFREYSYEKSGLNGFIAFAVKIVMKGTNTADPPVIKDFGVIALAL